jgi:hypothetical protein
MRRAFSPALALAVLLAGLIVLPASPVAAAEAATDAASSSADQKRRSERIERLFDYLIGEYGKRLKRPDWVTRSVALISLNRIPTEEATEVVLERLGKERHELAQLVAWQAMLSRARLLSSAQHERWMEVTLQMMRGGAFHGRLRIGLLEMLSASPATPQTRRYFAGLFRETSTLDSSDLPTLIAMGRALKAWGDAELVEQLIRALGDPNTAVRAELILQAAGADVPWNRTPQARKVYAEWWEDARDGFVRAAEAARADEAAWRRLEPQFIEAPMPLTEVDPDDRRWRDELELGQLELGQLDFAIAIDISGSMRAELQRLKRDVRVMLGAFIQVAREPRIGLTLFTVRNTVKAFPLTGDLKRLGAYLGEANVLMPRGRGRGRDEEWAGGLLQTIRASKWSAAGDRNRRIILIISDEPITKGQAKKVIPIAKEAAKAGFRIYCVRIHSGGRGTRNPLSKPLDRTMTPPERRTRNRESKGFNGWEVYEQVAEITDGDVIDAYVPAGEFGLGVPLTGRTLKQAGSPVAIAPLYQGGGPTAQVLTEVLVDAINPQFADRVEPLVKILVAYSQQAAVRLPERRQWGKPDKMRPNRKQ